PAARDRVEGQEGDQGSMKTDTPRARWVRVQIKIIDVDEGKVPGQYNDAELGEQVLALPLTGDYGAVIALDELGQALRNMVAQAERVHPLPKPEYEPMTTQAAEVAPAPAVPAPAAPVAASPSADVD